MYWVQKTLTYKEISVKDYKITTLGEGCRKAEKIKSEKGALMLDCEGAMSPKARLVREELLMNSSKLEKWVENYREEKN